MSIYIEAIKNEIDKHVNQCPICGHTVKADVKDFNRASNQDGNTICEIVYRCPNDTCGRLFVGVYKTIGYLRRGSIRTAGSDDFIKELYEVYPYNFQEVDFEKEIVELSPDFIKIYNQALQADVLSLDEVAGIAYRKALEFLVKDYCVSLDPTKSKEIKSEFLGQTIDKRIPDEEVKELARRATWLGNDEAHYIKLFEDKDIKDLIKLIDLTVFFIATKLKAKKYLKEMKSKK